MTYTLEKDGFTIIRGALKNPEFYLRKLKEDSRVHSKTMWRLRFLMKRYFAQIWKTNNLVSSFDGNVIGKMRKINWHVDQNITHGDCLMSVQGVLILYPSNVTQFLSGSHKYFGSLSKRCTSNNPYEWESYAIPDDDYIWKKGLKICTPELNPGDLLIFDPRIVHRVLPTNKRASVYISMVPRFFLSNLIERQRKKVYKKNWGTTHWCDRIVLNQQDEPIQNNLRINSLV